MLLGVNGVLSQFLFKYCLPVNYFNRTFFPSPSLLFMLNLVLICLHLTATYGGKTPTIRVYIMFCHIALLSLLILLLGRYILQAVLGELCSWQKWTSGMLENISFPITSTNMFLILDITFFIPLHYMILVQNKIFGTTSLGTSTFGTSILGSNTNVALSYKRPGSDSSCPYFPLSRVGLSLVMYTF